MDDKINAMYAEYGKLSPIKCRSCPYLEPYTTENVSSVWVKCQMYGTIGGRESDWSGNYDACGAFRIRPGDALRRGLLGAVQRKARR